MATSGRLPLNTHCAKRLIMTHTHTPTWSVFRLFRTLLGVHANLNSSGIHEALTSMVGSN